MGKIGGSLVSILVYFAQLWVVPASGLALGAKIRGHGADFRHMYGRGISGHLASAIGFNTLLMAVASVESAVDGMPTATHPTIFLLVSQIGCTLGTVWGFWPRAGAVAPRRAQGIAGSTRDRPSSAIRVYTELGWSGPALLTETGIAAWRAFLALSPHRVPPFPDPEAD